MLLIRLDQYTYPMQFPDKFKPTAITNRRPGIQAVAQFVSQSGFSQKVSGSCDPFGFEVTLVFEADQIEQQKLFSEFWYQVGGGGEVSLCNFWIPDCNPMWSLILDWSVHSKRLRRDQLGRAWWELVGRPDTSPELCFFVNNEMTIRNVYHIGV